MKEETHERLRQRILETGLTPAILRDSTRPLDPLFKNHGKDKEVEMIYRFWRIPNLLALWLEEGGQDHLDDVGKAARDLALEIFNRNDSNNP